MAVEDEEGGDSRALALARELLAARTRDGQRGRELDALREKVSALAMQLAETTDELEKRAEFAGDAVAQIARLEADAAAARRALLSREMQLQDAARENKALETELEGKTRECDHWEAEFHRVGELLDEEKSSSAEMKVALLKLKKKGKLRKAQSLRFIESMDDMKRHAERSRTKEQQLMLAIEAQNKAISSTERIWASRVEQEEQRVSRLQEQVRRLVEEKRRGEKSRSKENETQKSQQAANSELEAEKREQTIKKLNQANLAVDNLRTKELLFRREVVRLREELLLSESQRQTDKRRHEQLIRGKEKEVEFIWIKYADLVSSLQGNSKWKPHAAYVPDSVASALRRSRKG